MGLTRHSGSSWAGGKKKASKSFTPVEEGGGRGMPICAQLLAVAETLWSVTSRYGSFGTALGLILQRDGGRLTPVRMDSAATEWQMPWPNWAARSDGKLCLATALALADEISSYGGMACWDKKRRAGLTLSISATLAGRSSGEVPSVASGEPLHFVSRKLKTGRQLGYMELEVWRGSPSDEQYYHASSPASSSSSSSAELLAMGRHSKMLSLPAPLLSTVSLAERAGASSLYPIIQPPAIRLFERLYPAIKSWPPLNTQRGLRSSRTDLFPPLEATASAGAAAGAEVAARVVEAPLLRMAGGAAPSSYAASLSPTWSNLMGNMHGGAACMLGEQIAAASYAHTMGVGVDAAPPARMMHVQLLSGLVCDGRVGAFEAVTSPARGGGGAQEPASTLATMRHATDAGRAVECMTWWA